MIIPQQWLSQKDCHIHRENDSIWVNGHWFAGSDSKCCTWPSSCYTCCLVEKISGFHNHSSSIMFLQYAFLMSLFPLSLGDWVYSISCIQEEDKNLHMKSQLYYVKELVFHILILQKMINYKTSLRFLLLLLLLFLRFWIQFY